MAQNRIWQPSVVKCADDVDYRVPSDSGDRSIVCHLGSAETGLLEDCLLMFTGRKRANPDYHSEMNGSVFLHWLEDTVFAKLKADNAKSVVVLDRATYHTMVTEDTRWPVTTWRKSQLISAIKKWSGPQDDDWPILWEK